MGREAVRNVPAIRDQHCLLERDEKAAFLGQPAEGLEEVAAHEDVLVDAADVLAAGAARRGVEREYLRERAVLLLDSCNLRRDRDEASDPCGLGRQRESVSNGRLASPIAHHDLHLFEHAHVGRCLGRVVERRLKPPDRIALIAVVTSAEDQRQLGPGASADPSSAERSGDIGASPPIDPFAGSPLSTCLVWAWAVEFTTTDPASPNRAFGSKERSRRGANDRPTGRLECAEGS